MHRMLLLSSLHGKGMLLIHPAFISWPIPNDFFFRLGDLINEWRYSIDLEPVAFSEGPRLAETLKIPFTYCWSPALVAKPIDWGSHIGMF